MAAFTVAPRPPAGSKGVQYDATTNCFRVSIVRKLAFHHYHVIKVASNKRDIYSVTRRRNIIKKLYIYDSPNVFQPGQVVYDGKAALYTSKDLGPDRDLHFELRESHEGPKGSNLLVTLEKVGYISPNDFDALRSHERQADTALTAQQILNLLLHNATPDDFRRVEGRNTMFSMAKEDRRSFGIGLEFVRGCFASVRLARDHLLLNVDVCSAIMYESNELKDVAAQLLGVRDYRRLGDREELNKLLTLLKTVRVRQIKAGKIGRVRSIRKLIPGAGHQTFYLQDGTQTTVQMYFLQVHNYQLRHPDLPGICVVKKDRYNDNADKTDIIPFELLEVVEGQFYRRKLDSLLHAEMQQLSTIDPRRRMNTIARHLQAFSPNALASAGLHADRNPVSICGRILPAPVVQFKNESFTPSEGAWKLPRMSRGTFHKPCVVNNWAVLCYDRDIGIEDCRVLLVSFISCFHYFGIETYHLNKGLPHVVIRHENPQGDKLKACMKDVVHITKVQYDNRGFLLLVILPGGTKGVIYEQIKRICDTTQSSGMVTQCLDSEKVKKPLKAQSPSRIGRKLDRNLEQYLCNLVLKINVKVGGINFVPEGNGMEWIHQAQKNDATMVIGLDVSHPGPGIIRPSMASLVYSVDNNASRYFALCSPQPPRMEAVEELKRMTSKALIAFSQNLTSEYLPAHILVYRDGLSEGELMNVCGEEIQAIRAAIAEVWEGAHEKTVKVPTEEVKITYVVVGKRHHVRFFPKKGCGDRSGNCPSGFVTDDAKITHPHIYDFFLQSHAGLLGTSRPGHYIVIKDDHKFSADVLQSITFGLCHTFSRATRAVSIPAPVYYAHLVCRRAAIHVEYIGNESEHSSMGSGDVEFNRKDWAFEGLNDLQKRLMYFA